jgi:hypothetical protein
MEQKQLCGRMQVVENMVARDGVEPPTPAFSVRSLGLTAFSINSLTRQHGQFIVTSADVRQASATGIENSGVATLHGLNWKSELPQ